MDSEATWPAPPARADVAIVGYGPVGQLLGILLGRAGHRVAIIERQVRAYPLPRAVHFDDEIGRILQGIGLSPENLQDVVGPYDDFYEWRSADDEPLVRLDWRGPGPSGWHVSHFFHQPGLEEKLDAEVRKLPTVSVHRGWRAVERDESAEAVELSLLSPDGEAASLTADWVIGADGANSVVRWWIGSGMTDLGYFHDWLVVDLARCTPEAERHFRPPAWQLCDPARPTTLVPAGPGRRRFEFMRLDHETQAELSAESAAWRLLEPWGITPGNSRIERSAVYTFQARWCDQWRVGRLLIAGDAAHLMPPFAGQGMCSGLRDAVNLAWKLDLVLRGLAAPALLDTYGPERAEHVRHFIAASMELGEVICLTDPAAAAQRDRDLRAALRDGVEPPPRPLPRLGAGLHRDDPGGGTLSIQAPVSHGDRIGLFDDVAGPGGVLVSTEPVDDSVRDSLARFGFRVVTMGGAPGSFVDTTGAYGAWLGELAAVAALIRPDHYVYGTAATTSEVPGLVRDFTAALAGTAPADRRGGKP